RRPHPAEEGVGIGVDAAELPLPLGAARQPAPADHRFGALGDHIEIRTLGAVLGLEEQPLGLAALGACPDQVPAALQLLPVQDGVDVSLAPLLLDLARRDGVVCAAVPDDAVPSSVLAVRDAPLEVTVNERVVLGLHGQAFLAGVVARALGGGPARE